MKTTVTSDCVQECRVPDEETHIRKLIALLKKKMEKDYAPGHTRRDAHPKAHGCVQAEFTVASNLPEELRVGIFEDERSYPAWIRFSNGSDTIQSDLKKDLRGMALKIIGIAGKKLLEDELDAHTQDFLLLSHPIFPIKNVTDFHELVDDAIRLHLAWFFLKPFDSHLHEAMLFLRAMQHHVNPLDIRYWSTTPYLLGTHAVKYSIKPTSPNITRMPAHPGDNHLCAVMKQQLAERNACFDFMVQLQTDPKTMPIEDASVLWDESLSPFRTVASITIPSQQFDSEAQMAFCENLSFTPWHSLPEHRPLGSINRARKDIYQELSTFRHQRNNVVRQEPTGDETFST